MAICVEDVRIEAYSSRYGDETTLLATNISTNPTSIIRFITPDFVAKTSWRVQCPITVTPRPERLLSHALASYNDLVRDLM
jgi:hypothetical protein